MWFLSVWSSIVTLALVSALDDAASSSAEAPAAPARADRIRGALLGALVSDALCLGSHYEYDAGAIRKAYDVAEDAEPAQQTFSYMAPGERMGGSTHGIGWGRRNYHPGQGAGDQTDYGEYNMLTLEYLAGRKTPAVAIDLKDFLPVWRARLESENWGAWRCTQTKQALQQVRARGLPNVDAASLGGMSNAMAVRSAAVFGVFQDEDAAAQASATLMFTHRNPHATVGGEFFTRVTHKIIFDALSPSKALKLTCGEMGKGSQHGLKDFVQTQCDKGFAKFREAADKAQPLGRQPAAVVDDLAMTSMARLWDVGKSEPIKVGKASPTEGTMPSVIYMILKYEKLGLPAAARANALVGGDSASRAVAIGMVLGAWHGADAVPAELKRKLNHWQRAEQLLAQLPLLKDADPSRDEL